MKKITFYKNNKKNKVTLYNSSLPFFQGKKGIELTLQTVIIFIILLLVLFVMIYFFTTHYGSNSETLGNLGKDAIDAAKNT